MSKTVDERVVEMRFDNRQFESNVKTTMSTLERLKASLKFPKSSQSLDNISKSVKNVDFSGMQKGIETVNARFSALQVVGMTALSNITSAAMRAGSSLVSSFTIEPITSGFKEYELQMNSIQTILANTKSKGTSMDQVTAALNELNEYADLTIYNFAEMTKNIGTFTAAGVDLDTSVGAIKGIANLGAMSSSTSAQVSSAMYQLSQALATGRVSLMDWNSVVNAGMGGEQFQTALKRTAENFGYDVDSMIEKYGSFRESLTQGGWLTAEILTETLNQIGGAYDENALRAKGYSEENIKAILDMAQTATEAATDVKTFTQLMDTLKEAAGSGWAQVWQSIFGDFEQAKVFFSDLHSMLEPVVIGPIDALNNVISGAMGGGESRWGEFTQKITDAGASVEDFQKSLANVYKTNTGRSLDDLIEQYGNLEEAMHSGEITSGMVGRALRDLSNQTTDAAASTKTLAEWQKVVDDVWMGTYGNIDTGRVEKLAAAGWEYAEVQKLVNATVDGHRLTLEDLSAAQIESMGYTKEQSQALADLAAEMINAGNSSDTLISDILAPKLNGRELFLEGLKNTLTAIIEPLQAIGAAFSDVFGMSSQDLYDLIKGFNEFSKSIKMNGDDLGRLRKTFKGIFSVIHTVSSLVGDTLVAAFKGVSSVLAPFSNNILRVTAFLGECVYEFDRWITSANLVQTAIDIISGAFTFATTPIRNFVNAFSSLPGVSSVISKIAKAIDDLKAYFSELLDMSPAQAFDRIRIDLTNVFNAIKNLKWEDVLNGISTFRTKVGEFFTNLVKDFQEIGPDIIEGLQNGLKDGVDGILEWIRNLASKIIEVAKAVLGIHSPSTVFFEIGKNIIEGLCNGIKFLSGQVRETLLAIINDIKAVFAEVDWGAVLAVGAGVGTFIVFYQLTDALQTFATGVKQFSAPFQSAAKIFDTTNDFLQKLTGGNSSNKGFANIAQGLKLMAEAVAILVGSIAVLAVLDPSKMWQAVAVIGALAAILGGLAIALNKFAADGKILQSINLNSTFLSLAASFAILAVAARILGSMEWGDLGKAGAALLAFGAVVGALVGISHFGNQIDGVAKVLSKIGVAFLLLSVTAKLLGGMTSGEMTNAGIMLAGFTGVIAALVAVSYIGKDVDNVAKVLGKVGTAFLLLAATAKILGGMTSGEMTNAGIMLAAFTGVVAALIAVTQIGDKSIDNVTEFLGKVGIAFLALAVAARLLGSMEPGDMAKAGVALVGLTAVIAGLVGITHLAPKDKIAQISTTLLAMSASIAILAGVSALLGFVKTENLVKGIAAVAALSTIVALMTIATKGARDVKGTMMGIAIAIGTMAAAVAVLSFIDPGKLAGATAAISVLMGMLALVLKAAPATNKAMSTIVAITVFMGLVSAALFALAGLPTESVLGSALSLSAVLIAMASACAILDGVGKISGSAIGAMAVMGLIVAGLAVIFSQLGTMSPEAAIPNAIALSTVLIAMSAACSVLDNIKSVSGMALVAMGVLTAVVAGLALIMSKLMTINPQSAIPNAIALSTLLLTMAGVTAILATVGNGAMAAIKGAAALAGVTAIIGVVIAAIVGIAGAIGQIEGSLEFIQRAGEVLNGVGNALGSFVAGVGEGLTSTLPQIGSNIAAFGENLQPFFAAMSGIDPSIGSTLQSLGVGLLALTGSNILDQLTQFFGGDSTMSTLSTNLPLLGIALSAFNASLAGISDFSKIQSGAEAFKVLAEAMSQVPNSGGLLGDLLGGKDYATFATGMESIGAALASFDGATQGITAETLQPKANALSTLISAMANVPNSGGFLGEILGGKDYSGFSDSMANIGAGLASFNTATSGVTVEGLQPKIEALNSLITAMSSIENTGGFLQELLGGPDYSGFADSMGDIGEALSSFYTSCTEIGDIAVLNTGIEALKNVITVLADLPTDTGWLGQLLGGETDYDGFTSGLESIGNALGKYAEAIPTDMTNVTTSITQVKTLINFLKTISDDAETIGDGIANIKKIGEVGTAIKTYSDNMGGVIVADVSTSVTAIQNLVNAITSMAGMDTSGIATFKQAIEDLSTISLDGVIAAFNNAASQMVQAGANIMNNLASGLQSGQGAVTGAVQTVVVSMAQTLVSTYPSFVTGGNTISMSLAQGVANGGSTVSTALTSVLASAANSIRGYYGSFYSAGAYITQGLANGMNSMLGRVRSAATQIADEAARAARAAAQVKSPSRVFMKIGGYMGEGMIIGLETYQSKVYDAGYAIGDEASKGLTKAIEPLSKMSFDNMDLNPVITPVIDLDNVKNGVKSIDSMFNLVPPIDVMANLNSINGMMNARIQNGSIDDVVKAVNRLNTKLDNMPVNQYNVNGITYDDGTNVARAVGDLTRSIKLERRI